MIATWRAIALLFGFGPCLAHAAPIVETDIDHDYQPLKSVYLIVQPAQPSFMGTSPELPTVPEPGNYDVFHFFTSIDQLGISGAATAIQTAFVMSDKRRFETEAMEADRPFFNVDYAALNTSLLRDIDMSANWQVVQLAYVAFYNSETRTANDKGPIRQALKIPGIDLAISVRSSFYLSPTLNQVRVLVETRIESKKQHHRLRAAVETERSYEYLSPIEGVALRQWNPGEREARISSIEAAFENSVSQYPDNRDSYEQERDAALEFLNQSETIPPALAIQEYWSSDKLQLAFERGSSILNQVIRRDLQSVLSDDYPRSKFMKVSHLDYDGKPTKIRVQVVDSVDGQVVYRAKSGSLFVLPEL